MDDPIKISPQLLSKAGASTVRLAPGDVIFGWYFSLFVMRDMVDRLWCMNEQWFWIRPAPFQDS
jgi:hypothetical protein